MSHLSQHNTDPISRLMETMGIASCPRCSFPLDASAADAVFDEAHHGILVNGEVRHVAKRTWQILEILRQHRGKVVRPDAFYHHVWELEIGDPPLVEQAVKVHIHRLRRVLTGTGWQIGTIRGVGYILERKDAVCNSKESANDS